jgi:hypothetical protein
VVDADPVGLTKMDTLVLAAEAAAALVVDNAKVETSALPLLAARLRTQLQGRRRRGGVERGQQQQAAVVAIMPTMQGQFLTMTAATFC